MPFDFFSSSCAQVNALAVNAEIICQKKFPYGKYVFWKKTFNN